MIKIDRYSRPKPTSLSTPKNATDRQRSKAKLYYQSIPAPTTAFEFDKYKEPDVVSTLELLFNGKCAYCESNYTATSKMDVEHYRPKGKVNECPTHTGYWWLALDWDNLLPSCIDCNRSRGQKKAILNPDGSIIVTINGENSGKENAFPVDGNFFAMNENCDHTLENPLIINPCDIHPHEHLDWHTSYPSLPVIYAKNNEGSPDIKGECTIKILGLNRWGLVNERGELLQQLAIIVKDINDLIDIALIIPKGDARNKILKKIDEKIKYLVSFGLPNNEYSAMSKCYIDNQLFNIKKDLQNLKTSL